jgi:hypothetical protein
MMGRCPHLIQKSDRHQSQPRKPTKMAPVEPMLVHVMLGIYDFAPIAYPVARAA